MTAPAPSVLLDLAELPRAVLDIANERFRQIEDEGWTLEHDDEHDKGEMAHAAGCYALANHHRLLWVGGNEFPDMWPWHKRWWKSNDRRGDLVKAGELIVAEIERLDRLRARSTDTVQGE